MPERAVKSIRRKPLCPECGYDDQVVPIIYGEPDRELIEESQRGEVALGGCITDASPAWYCKGCLCKFDSPGRR
ncbi:MAG: hypothetical protein ACE14M_16675 [Terriglobales bacterium]